jgi:hypothetical protein
LFLKAKGVSAGFNARSIVSPRTWHKGPADGPQIALLRQLVRRVTYWQRAVSKLLNELPHFPGARLATEVRPLIISS